MTTTTLPSSGEKHVVLGTGPLGRATAIALLAGGKRRVILVNRKGTLESAPLGASIASGDLRNLASLRPIVADATAIYFCAQPPYHKWADQFPALQDGAIALAKGSGAKLIVAENLYGCGTATSRMTEDTPLQPNTRKGQLRVDMHRDLMGFRDSGTLKVAVARGSDFFGPHVDGSAAGARAFRAVVAGKAVEYFGNLNALHSYTFVSDFGSVLAKLGTDDRALGEVWHVPNAGAVTSRQFFELAFEIAGTIPRFRKIGVFEMRAFGLLIPPLREMVEMAYEFEQDFVSDGAKFSHTFGGFATPLREAIAETVNWTCLNHSR